jgi:hypothetical protein
MSLKELLRLAPPPPNPISMGTDKDFLLIENQIGGKLPRDYKEYIRHYGGCMWYRHIIINAPIHKDDSFSLWGWHKQNIQQLKTLFEGPLPLVKYPVFPEPGGIFLCGGDIFGEMIAWITEGEPDNWSIVYFNYDCASFDKYDMNLTTFLLKLVKKEIHPDCFTSDLYDLFKDRPIATVTSLDIDL